tara:strand:+ start:452 stop:796 length:345 start_codon:yes stop_codon:yes gene_type:complete
VLQATDALQKLTTGHEEVLREKRELEKRMAAGSSEKLTAKLMESERKLAIIKDALAECQSDVYQVVQSVDQSSRLLCAATMCDLYDVIGDTVADMKGTLDCLEGDFTEVSRRQS